MHFQNCEVREAYSNVGEEYKAISTNAGLSDIPWKKVIRVEGPDAKNFLDRMLSNKIVDLRPRQGCHATLLKHTGHMISDLHVLCFENHFLLITDFLNLEVTLNTLNKFIVADQVEVFDTCSLWLTLSLMGVEAPSILDRWAHIQLKNNFDHESIHDCHVYKFSYSPFPGFHILVSREKIQDVKAELVREGAVSVGFNTLQVLRIEAGQAWYPNEISEKTIPLEVNFQDAIHYNKECYVGQETIAKATYRGHVNKQLVGLELDGDWLPLEKSEIFKDNQEVGWVTSSVYSLKLKKNIALGFVKYDVRVPGTEVAIKCDQKEIPAEIVILPF